MDAAEKLEARAVFAKALMRERWEDAERAHGQDVADFNESELRWLAAFREQAR